MNIIAPDVKIHQSLSSPADLLINHFIQRHRISPYPGAYSREIRDFRVDPLLIHRPLEGGVVNLSPVHSKIFFANKITSPENHNPRLHLAGGKY